LYEFKGSLIFFRIGSLEGDCASPESEDSADPKPELELELDKELDEQLHSEARPPSREFCSSGVGKRITRMQVRGLLKSLNFNLGYLLVNSVSTLAYVDGCFLRVGCR
jgi:hypothetical protein